MAARSVRARAQGDPAIAVDLGGTQLRAALIAENGTVISRDAEPTQADAGPAAVVAQIASLVSRVLDGRSRQDVAGAGVCSPGPLDTRRGLALGIPTLKGFDQFPFRGALHDALAVPVALENDGIAAAIGEWRYGAGKGLDDIVYVTVSTGIGGGVISGGHVLRGVRGMAGHVGHMSFVAGGEPCFCGNRGCFEAYASGTAFSRRAAAASAQAGAARMSPNAHLDSQAVFAAAALGNPLARQLVDEEARYLGRGFASLMHLYNPAVLIMGGGLAQQFDVMRDTILDELRSTAMPAFRDTPVVRAQLGGDSGLLGAAALVFAGECR